MQITKQTTNTLLGLGLIFGVAQVAFIGMMLFGGGPTALGWAVKAVVFGSLAAFIVVGLRAARRA
ncbi:MAG: hypothetical protein AAF125_18795 [Chloroflexota bacterium]